MRTLILLLGRAVGAALALLLALLVLLAAVETGAWALLEVSWAETSEVSGVLLIWFGLLGAAWGVHHRIHLAVDVLTRLLPEAVGSALGRLAAALVALFGGLLAFNGALLAASVTNTLPATGLDASVQYFPAVVGGALIALFASHEMVYGAGPRTDGDADD